LSCCKTSQKRPAVGAILTTTSSQGRCDKRAYTQMHTHAHARKNSRGVLELNGILRKHALCLLPCVWHASTPPASITNHHTPAHLASACVIYILHVWAPHPFDRPNHHSAHSIAAFTLPNRPPPLRTISPSCSCALFHRPFFLIISPFFFPLLAGIQHVVQGAR
jgi:hypothetical protein